MLLYAEGNLYSKAGVVMAKLFVRVDCGCKSLLVRRNLHGSKGNSQKTLKKKKKTEKRKCLKSGKKSDLCQDT